MAKKSSAENANVCAGLAYFLIGIIWYFVDEKMKGDPLARQHVQQALVLLIVSFAGNFVLAIIPIIGWILLPFFNLAVFIVALLNLIAAFQGKEKELPVIGKYGAKFDI